MIDKFKSNKFKDMNRESYARTIKDQKFLPWLTFGMENLKIID